MLFLSPVKRHLPELFLTLILFLICLNNYTPNTYLIGWDNLVPELNIWLNLKRSLFAVWQEYQGLGLVGGMAHSTDLIRQLILLPFILILPNHLIRYLWHFSMIFLGTFGVYFGLKKNIKNRLTALSASLFYLLNFGSIQYFWNPLETFSTFWGFFPWLIFSLINYLKKPSRQNLIKLTLLNLLAIPSFYVQTLFIVYLICVFVIFVCHLFYHHLNYKTEIINFFKITLIIFFLNSFWILPQLYFLKTNLDSPTQGIGNFMSNEETFNRNLARGNLNDFLLLRGYYYDFPNNSSYMMAPWVNHLSNSYILICGYIISAFVIIGFIFLLCRPKRLNSANLSLLLLFTLSCLTLLTNTPPFNYINQIFRNSLLINQIFRSPWTKFIVPAIFSFSLLTAYGLDNLIKMLKQLKYRQKTSSFLIHTFYLTLLLIFSLPSFKGYYISPDKRVAIPSQYLQLFEYFKHQSPSGRIANLPQGSFWGWTNYNWKNTGSGFLWYGIKQPILDRAFDAWNLKNEQYYWHLTTALQKKDPILIKNVFDQYNIQYIIFDNSVIFPDDKIYSKLSLSTQNFLSSIPGLTLIRQFNQLFIYEYQNPTSPYLISNPPSILPFGFSIQDPVFDLIGDYVVTNQANTSFPFADLFTNRLQDEIPFSVSLNKQNINLSSHNFQTSFPIDYSVNSKMNFSSLKYPNQSIIINNQTSFYHLENQHNQDLFVINFPEAKLSQSYLIQIEYRHISGLPLDISAVSDNSQNKYFFTQLDKNKQWSQAWFIIPSRQQEDFHQGLNIIFNNKSLNHIRTINNIKSATLFPFPYNDLIYTHNFEQIPTKTQRQYLNFSNHLFFYRLNVNNIKSSDYLVLPQSHDSGWLAFYFNGIKPVFLKDHVLINNWANGWFISPELQAKADTTLYILFWPQILEFIGLAFLLIPLVYIAKIKKI